MTRGMMLLVAVVLVWPQPYFPKLRSPNELIRVYLSRSLVDDAGVRVNNQVARYGPLADYAQRDGGIYCDKAPGLSWLGALTYGGWRLLKEPSEISNAALIKVMRVMWLMIPWLLVGFYTSRFVARRVSPRWGTTSLVAWMFATPSLAYAHQWVGHLLCGICVMAAMLMVETSRRQITRLRLLLFSGMVAAFAGCVEYTALPMLAVLGVCIICLHRDWRSLGIFLVGASVPLLLLGIYHHQAFGTPLTFAYSFVKNPGFAGLHQQGLWGVGLPSATALWELSFGFKRGLWWLAPWLFVAPWAVVVRRRSWWVWLLAVQVLLHSWVATSFGLWTGGWAVGPRHLVPAMGALVVLAFVAWDDLIRRVPASRMLLFGTMTYSSVVMLATTGTYPGFPPDIASPLAQFVFPAFIDGQGAASLGTQLGLASKVSLWSWVAIAVGVVVLTWAWLESRRLRATARGLSLCAALVAGLFVMAPSWDAQSLFRVTWLRAKKWEPPAQLNFDRRLLGYEEAKRRLQQGRARPSDHEALGAMKEHLGHPNDLE